MNIQRADLNSELRKLWEQHVMWTRSFIISTAENLSDISMVTKRLLENPKDFSNLLQKFYGKKRADEFERLFTEHLTIAASLVNEAKAGNTRGADEAREKWYANADEIAKFLASINPYWKFYEWQTLLHDHLKMTEEEAANRLNKQYAADIMLYDEIENEALKMADLMTRGIRRQFYI